MRIPSEGETLTNAAGQKWIVESVTLAEELADDLDDADTLDPGYYQITLVEGDDPDDMGALGIELDSDEFAQFCQDNGIRL